MDGCRVQDAAKVPQLRAYALRRVRVPVGQRVLSVVVPDAAAWRREGDWVAGVVRGGEPPYWCRIWPAAVAVARLLARGGDLRGLRIADIGCGLGLPGIAAAGQGAAVTFVDREPAALAFAAWNADKQAGGPMAATVCLDWREGLLPGRFHALVLADVSYRPVHHAPLLRQIEQCLAEDGLVLHADPMRRESGPFVAALRQQGPVGVLQRRTTFGDQVEQVRLCLATRSVAALTAWAARLSLGDLLEVEAP